MENQNIIKNGHSEDDTSDTSKPVNSKNLRDNLELASKLLKFPGLLVLKRRVSAKIKCCAYFLYALDDRYGTSSGTLRPADNFVET